MLLLICCLTLWGNCLACCFFSSHRTPTSLQWEDRRQGDSNTASSSSLCVLLCPNLPHFTSIFLSWYFFPWWLQGQHQIQEQQPFRNYIKSVPFDKAIFLSFLKFYSTMLPIHMCFLYICAYSLWKVHTATGFLRLSHLILTATMKCVLLLSPLQMKKLGSPRPSDPPCVTLLNEWWSWNSNPGNMIKRVQKFKCYTAIFSYAP